MIRDSIIYIDMDKITNEPQSFNYTTSLITKTDRLHDMNDMNDVNTNINDVNTNINDVNTNINDVNTNINDETNNKKSNYKIRTPFSSSNTKKAFAYLRPLHCHDNNLVQKLYASKYCKKEEFLSKGYDAIFSVKEEKKYVMSIHYLNYQPNYITYLNNIMVSPPNLFTIMCEPLDRAIRHFNHSNSFRSIYTFEEYYYHFGDKEKVGWTGIKDITNNYFSHYLGFRNLQDITKENIIERFSLIMIVEKEELSVKKLNTLLKTKIKSLELKNNQTTSNEYKINAFTKHKFKHNNTMDYLLYDLCCEILES